MDLRLIADVPDRPREPASTWPGRAEGARPLSVLITGFGPFPGAPFNPTEPLVAKLLRRRRPALAGLRLAGHVFQVSYAAVDRELPELMRRHRPDVVLMFGLAARTRHLRVEVRARNVTTAFPDATGFRGAGLQLTVERPPHLAFGPHCARLMMAARSSRVPARLSRDAGRYLCNYLCWRVLERTGRKGGPALAAFIHVPNIKRKSLPRSSVRARRSLTIDDLALSGEAVLLALLSTARRLSPPPGTTSD